MVQAIWGLGKRTGSLTPVATAGFVGEGYPGGEVGGVAVAFADGEAGAKGGRQGATHGQIRGRTAREPSATILLPNSVAQGETRRDRIGHRLAKVQIIRTHLARGGTGQNCNDRISKPPPSATRPRLRRRNFRIGHAADGQGVPQCPNGTPEQVDNRACKLSFAARPATYRAR